MSGMKVLFLDFDGVLNTYSYRNDAFSNRHKSLAALGSEPIDDEMERLKLFYALIDPQKVGLVNEILSRTGAVVVISSSWRHVWPLEDIVKGLGRRGFRGTIIDKTPTLIGPRGDEIIAWVRGSGPLRGVRLAVPGGVISQRGVQSFAVLDDMASAGYGIGNRFVHTNGSRGITREDVERAVRRLNS